MFKIISLIFFLYFLLNPYTGQSQCANDTIPPTMICTPFTSNIPITGNTVAVSAIDIGGASMDNCGIASLSINGSPSISFTCTDIGFHPVTVTATDSSGNTDSCFSTIYIQDVIPPTTYCRITPYNLLLDSTGFASISAESLIDSVTDNCGSVMLLANGQDTLTFSCADLGTSLVSVFAQDFSGNSSFTCNTIVSISDNGSCTTNAKEIKEENSRIYVYPNPAHNSLTIEAFRSQMKNIIIQTITGQVALSKTLNNKQKYQLDLTNFSHGLYILTIKTENGIFNKQILVE